MQPPLGKERNAHFATQRNATPQDAESRSGTLTRSPIVEFLDPLRTMVEHVYGPRYKRWLRRRSVSKFILHEHYALALHVARMVVYYSEEQEKDGHPP